MLPGQAVEGAVAQAHLTVLVVGLEAVAGENLLDGELALASRPRPQLLTPLLAQPQTDSLATSPSVSAVAPCPGRSMAIANR